MLELDKYPVMSDKRCKILQDLKLFPKAVCLTEDLCRAVVKGLGVPRMYFDRIEYVNRALSELSVLEHDIISKKFLDKGVYVYKKVQLPKSAKNAIIHVYYTSSAPITPHNSFSISSARLYNMIKKGLINPVEGSNHAVN